MVSFITKIRRINGVRRKVKITKTRKGKERIRVVGYVNKSDKAGKNYKK